MCVCVCVCVWERERERERKRETEYSASSLFSIFLGLHALPRLGNPFIIIYYSLEFFHQWHLMVFHWSLRDSKSPQVSRTLLNILAVFNNAVIWMVSTRSPTSKSSRPFNNPLVTVPKAPITIGIIVTFRFHSFFNSLARCKLFPSDLTAGFSLEFELLQVSSGLLHSSKYSS